MNKAINKFTLIFMILMIALPIFSFNVGATESTIHSDLYGAITSNGRTACVTQNGTIYAGLHESTTLDIQLFYSLDNGATWIDLWNYDKTTNEVYSLSLLTDDDDRVWIFHVEVSGATFSIRARAYKDNVVNKSFNAFTSCDSQQGQGGLDAICDSSNIYVAYTFRTSGNTWSLKVGKYNFILDTWSSTTVRSGFANSITRPSLCKFGNSIYCFYNNNNKINCSMYDISADSWTHSTAVESGTYVYANPRALVDSSKIYLFYDGTTPNTGSYDAILYKTYSTSWSGQNVIVEDNGYDQKYPHPSKNSNGNINVVWHGQNSESPTYYQLRQKIYSSGAWGDTAFISSGAIQKNSVKLIYQDYPTFTHLTDGISLVYYDTTGNDLEYLDSGSMIWYSDSDYQGDFDFDANNNIGTLDSGCIMNVANKDVEFKYQIPTTINATGFDLLVGAYMYSVSQDLSNYDLFINGEPMGNPTEWKAYGSQYVLRWTFSSEKVITNSEILFEVWHDQLVSGYSYWMLGVSCNYEDLDGDGIATMRYSNTYPNGAFDGTWLAKDVSYQLYYNVIQFVEDDVDVTYNSISYVNTTYHVGESVPLTYTLKSSDMVYDNYVRIWNDDTATEITLGTMQGFPYLCTHQVETIGFVPFTSSNYTARLYVNDVDICNVSFFVDEQINANMSVFTYENPSTVGQKIWVYYNFDHPTGKNGAIFVSLTSNLNNYISVNYLADGDSGFWTTSHDTVGVYYYIMAVDIDGNGTYGIVNNGIHPHTVRSEYGDNYFRLGGYNIRLNEDGTITQTVSGECNMVSGNCYIYDNNELVKTITESPFSYSYDVHTSGLHTVEMRLITNTTIILYTQNYTITSYTGDEDIEQVEDSGYVFRDWIYTNYGDIGIFLTGVLIILGFMLIPFALVLYVNVKFNKDIAVGDIHWSIYLIFAIVGVAVTVMLHIADLWLILLIVVSCITIAVVIFKGNR